MAVTSTPKKVSVSARLNNGLDGDGNVVTVGISLGTLSISGYDDAKALSVVSALEPCLSKEVYSVDKTYVTSIETE